MAENCEPGLCTLKVYLLEHVIDDLERLRDIEVSNVTAFERFNVHIKQQYNTASQRQSLSIVETIGIMDSRMEDGLRSTDGMQSVELSRAT